MTTCAPTQTEAIIDIRMLPPAEVSPNSHVSWRKKARAAFEFREEAAKAAKHEAIGTEAFEGRLDPVTIDVEIDVFACGLDVRFMRGRCTFAALSTTAPPASASTPASTPAPTLHPFIDPVACSGIHGAQRQVRTRSFRHIVFEDGPLIFLGAGASILRLANARRFGLNTQSKHVNIR